MLRFAHLSLALGLLSGSLLAQSVPPTPPTGYNQGSEAYGQYPDPNSGQQAYGQQGYPQQAYPQQGYPQQGYTAPYGSDGAQAAPPVAAVPQTDSAMEVPYTYPPAVAYPYPYSYAYPYYGYPVGVGIGFGFGRPFYGYGYRPYGYGYGYRAPFRGGFYGGYRGGFRGGFAGHGRR